MQSVTVIQITMTPADLAAIVREEVNKALKGVGKKEEDVWLNTQEAMSYLDIKSDEGFKAHRLKHRIKSKTIGSRKFYRKADLIKS